MHSAGHLREWFTYYLANGEIPPECPSLDWLIGQLWDCDDQLPGEWTEERWVTNPESYGWGFKSGLHDWGPVHTYGAAAQQLRRDLDLMVGNIRERLAEYFEERAEWRDLVAIEWPDDYRNTHCAEALRELALHVRKLPVDDERLRRISYGFWNVEPFWIPTEIAGQLASRYQFNPNSETPDGFLDRFVDQTEQDYAETVAGWSAGEPPGAA